VGESNETIALDKNRGSTVTRGRAMSRENKALEILDSVSRAAGYQTLLDAVSESLSVTVAKEKQISYRHAEKLIPILNRILKHSKCTETDRIRILECRTLVQSKADIQNVLAAFRMNSERVAVAKSLEDNKLSITTDERVEVKHDESIVASKSGLLEEAQRLADARKAPLHTDDLLRAMDQRFPYTRPTSPYRDLSELREELAVYLELDEVLSQAEDDSDPLKIGALHRIRLMKEVPDGPEPLWFRQIRWRAQIDLFFLARAVCGKSVTNYAHRALCEHFVLKNPHLRIEDQSSVKNRLTMCHRGFYKSTISILDAVQWITDFPNDIRIIILTSTLKLAKRFIGELSNYFVKAKNAQATVFQKLFPEFVIAPEERGLSTEFTIRDRKSSLKDPTAWAASETSEEVGSHCDLLILDDVETPKNTATPETLEGLIYRVGMVKMLVDPGGYSSTIGTPSCLNDLYDQMRRNVEGLKIFYKPVMTIKPEVSLKEEKDITESDVDIAFPERFTWSVIQHVKRENAAVFQSQYMLRPSGDSLPNFTLDLLQARTVKRENIPASLVNYQIWDLAYSLGAKSDSTVGVNIGQDVGSGTAFVTEIIQEKFRPEDSAEAMVDLYVRTRPKVVIIEDSLGAQNLRPTIERVAFQRGVSDIPLFFMVPSRAKNAKRTRISLLEPLIRSGLLQFSDDLSCLTELYEQFCFFGSTSHHDDLPDAIAMAFESGYLSRSPAKLQGDALERTRQVEKILREKDIYDRIFGPMADPPPTQLPIVEEWDNPPVDIWH
jgi:predicted phage terminase large subunit-like protein